MQLPRSDRDGHLSFCTTATLTAKRDQAIQRAKQCDQEAQDCERGRIVSDNQEALALRQLAALEKELAEANEAAKASGDSKAAFDKT